MALLDAVVPNVGGVILLFRGQLAVSGKNFREEYSWHLVRKLKEAAKHPTVQRAAPTTELSGPKGQQCRGGETLATMILTR